MEPALEEARNHIPEFFRKRWEAAAGEGSGVTP
jgi:hypothetical protein